MIWRGLVSAAVLFVLLACGAQQATPTPSGGPVTLGEQPAVVGGSVETGEVVPELTFQINGEPHKLSDYRGSNVIINFWETTCLPCRHEMPDFEALIHERSDVVVLAVNRRERPTLVEQFGQQYGLSFPLLLDRTGDVSTAFGVTNAIPTSFFIDKQGLVRRMQIGVMTRSQMSRYLNDMDGQGRQ